MFPLNTPVLAGRALALDTVPDVDTSGKPTKFDANMTLIVGGTSAAKLAGCIGKPPITTKECFICYEETSVAERQERIRGSGNLSQTEKLLIVTCPGILPL